MAISKFKDVYLAGPMTGIPEYNKAEFDSAARYLRDEGLCVFNPADVDLANGFDARGTTGCETKEELAALGFDLRKALAADLKFVAEEAEEVYVLPGYENSKGVAAELALAQALGLPIWYLRKHPDGSWYRRDSATGIGERKIDSQFYQRVEVKTLGEELGIRSATVEDFAKAVGSFGADPQSVTEGPTAYKNNGEVRMTSATGGQKGSKPERYDLIPVEPLKKLAQLYGFGASKYDDNNWQKGYDWKLSYAACQRHLNAFWGGEDNDAESGLPHLASAAWHCFTMMWFMDHKPEYDSRNKPQPTYRAK